ncbi:YihY/virulence factor BrkB family protein [Haloferula sp. BvORR071]|uniref:YihY/virulence factor BrkB family protein n=1 Tax=Haloferula sp. BvORR071 TaxID=1396141 RepID=UPI0005561531|nr:YihY/virulence factor BrkB family protein [Haloferula sp. BvORR071]
MSRRWVHHRHTDNSAALAFYALISFPPLLLIGVTVAGMVLGEKVAHGELEKQMSTVLGPDLATGIDGILQGARIAPRDQPLPFLVAMVTLAYAGSHVLTKLRNTLNIVNESAPADPSRPWLRRLGARALCAGLILAFGVLLVAATVAQGFTAYVAAHMDAPWLAELDIFQRSTGWLTTYFLLTLAFALIMKVLPRRRPMWKHAFVGGGIAALITVSLKTFLDVYFRYSMWKSFIGNGLNLLLFLFWLFVSIQAFLAGAEVSAWLGRRRKVRQKAFLSGK